LTAEHIRVAGVIFAAALAVYGVVKYRRGGWRRADLLLALLVASGVGVVSVFPQVGDPFGWLFRLDNRAFALLSLSNLVLFALFVYLLGQVRASNRRNGDIVCGIALREYRQRHSPPSPLPESARGRVMVVIPAYNEGGSIRAVLERLPRELLGCEVRAVVVDDGSSDGTEAAAAAAGCPVAAHVVNRGQGTALRTGFRIAELERADVVVNLDADGQYLPEEMERLVAPVLEGEADFVLGSRFLGYYEEAGSVRHAGVVFFSWLISLLTGRRITDCTNGFRAIRVSKLERLDLREDRFNATELILEALKNGLRFREVPVTMLRRAEGESKKPKRLAYPLGVFRVIVQTWLR
jgi:hypothetical protein